jgi:pilus assembly protein Flp/PilA
MSYMKTRYQGYRPRNLQNDHLRGVKYPRNAADGFPLRAAFVRPEVSLEAATETKSGSSSRHEASESTLCHPKRHQKLIQESTWRQQMVTLKWLQKGGSHTQHSTLNQVIDYKDLILHSPICLAPGSLVREVLYTRQGAINKVSTYTSTHGRILLMTELLKRLWQEEEGQDLTEYALLLVLIALAAITVMGTLGSAINNVFSTAASNLTAAS